MDYKMAAAELSKSNKHVLSRNSLISRCWGFFHFDFLLMLAFISSGTGVFKVNVGKFALKSNPKTPTSQPKKKKNEGLQRKLRPTPMTLKLICPSRPGQP